MQILANALPGFRDLRTPAIAGYLWLLFAWLLVDPDLSRRPQSALDGALYDAGHRVGHLGILVAISIAAYFVGSASQALADGLRELWRPVVNAYLRLKRIEIGPIEIEPINGETAVAGPSYRDPRLFEKGGPAEPFIRSLTEDFRHELDELRGFANDLQERPRDFLREQTQRHEKTMLNLERLTEESGRREYKAIYEANKDLARPAILLVGKEPELFAEVDRLRAESELRVAAIPPAFSLVVLACARGSLWWALAVFPLMLLLTQAVQKDDASRRTILEAVEGAPDTLKSIAEFSRWVDNASSHLTQIREELGG